MKIFKFMIVALVAMVGFAICSKDDCNHDFIEYDYNEALIGTWTYVEGELAEAMVINPDGSFEVTGIMKGGALYEEILPMASRLRVRLSTVLSIS